MAAKLRVRDLATELKVSNKDILNTLRRLGIQVRSHMSGLTEEDAALVRDEMNKTARPQSEVIRREVQPGVIVRRRKKPGGKAEGQDTTPEPEAIEEEEAPLEQEVHDGREEPVAHEEPVAETEIQDQEAEKEIPDLATPPAKEVERPAAQARIIKPVQEPEPEPVPETEDPAPAASEAEPEEEAAKPAPGKEQESEIQEAEEHKPAEQEPVAAEPADSPEEEAEKPAEEAKAAEPEQAKTEATTENEPQEA